MGHVPVVLASSSPRRREILYGLGLVFRVEHADVDESVLPGESARQTVVRLAAGKAAKVVALNRDCVVIGADTLVTLDGQVLGKPDDAPHAVEMLSLLGGRTHEVITGVAFVKADEGLEDVRCCVSTVTFRKLSREMIGSYVAGGEPIGKAGAYAIQGAGNMLIEGYSGSYTNIVGLPVTELLRFIVKFGADRLEWRVDAF